MVSSYSENLSILSNLTSLKMFHVKQYLKVIILLHCISNMEEYR